MELIDKDNPKFKYANSKLQILEHFKFLIEKYTGNYDDSKLIILQSDEYDMKYTPTLIKIHYIETNVKCTYIVKDKMYFYIKICIRINDKIIYEYDSRKYQFSL